MSLAKIRFVQKALIEKYGNVGIVASRYLEAGFSVRVNHPTHLGSAKLVRAKPILVLYGNGPKLSDELFRFCKERGVKIRRIRAQ